LRRKTFFSRLSLFVKVLQGLADRKDRGRDRPGQKQEGDMRRFYVFLLLTRQAWIRAWEQGVDWNW
jgi:hypothetical protein